MNCCCKFDLQLVAVADPNPSHDVGAIVRLVDDRLTIDLDSALFFVNFFSLHRDRIGLGVDAEGTDAVCEASASSFKFSENFVKTPGCWCSGIFGGCGHDDFLISG